MDPIEYQQRLQFLKDQRIVPADLHYSERQNWKKKTRNRYEKGWITESTHSEAFLQIKRNAKGLLGEKIEVLKAIPTRDEVLELLSATHIGQGHFGRDKMMHHLNQKWYWPGMKKDVSTFLANCEHCLTVKPDRKRPPLRPILATRIRERAMFDLTYMHVDSKTQERYILVVIDIFTKFIWTKGLVVKKKGGVMKYLVDTFKDQPFHIWQSDNGGEFKNKRLTAALNAMGGIVVHGRAYHPQSQGHVERVNGTLKTRLKSMLPSETAPWSHLLQKATWAYNTSIHSVIKMSPYLAETGKIAHTPDSIPTNPHLRKVLESMATDQTLEYSREALDAVLIQREQAAAEKRIKRYNKHALTVLFRIGEIVKIRRVKVSKSKKELKPYQWLGVISDKSENNCYKVRWIGQGMLLKDTHGEESGFLPTNMIRREGPNKAEELASMYATSEMFGGLFAQFNAPIPAIALPVPGVTTKTRKRKAEAVPEEAVPEEAVPEEAVPEEADPEEADPEEADLEEAAPGESDSESEMDLSATERLEEAVRLESEAAGSDEESEIGSGESSAEEEDEFDENPDEELKQQTVVPQPQGN
jgi:transposase InsO family protein